MNRFAAKSSDTLPAEPGIKSAKLLSLLMILEALRQEPVPLNPQKV